MTDRTAAGQRDAVYALLNDLLPVLSPGASLNQEQDELLVPLGNDRALVSTTSLLAACAGEEQQRWPQAVEAWFAAVDRQLADAAAGGRVDPGRLRVQAVPRDQTAADVRAGFNSAFDLLLVEDRAGSSRRLLPGDLQGLGMSAEEAVRAGLNATISDVLVRLDVRPHSLPGGGEIRMASADGVPYVSAGITSVRQLAGVDSSYGTLVGVPRHSMIVLQPVNSRFTLNGLPVLADLVGSMFDSGTDRCARAIYWFVGAEAYPVGVTARPDGRPAVSLPEELEALVASLPD